MRLGRARDAGLDPHIAPPTLFVIVSHLFLIIKGSDYSGPFLFVSKGKGKTL